VVIGFLHEDYHENLIPPLTFRIRIYGLGLGAWGLGLGAWGLGLRA